MKKSIPLASFIIWFSIFASLSMQAHAKRIVANLDVTLVEESLTATASLPVATDIEKSDRDSETQDVVPVYYIVGGMRVGLHLAENSLTAQEKALNPNIRWTFSSVGRVCDNERYTSNNSNCRSLGADVEYSPPPETANTLYWEPVDWSLGMSSDVTIEYDFNGQMITGVVEGQEVQVPYSNREHRFRIKNRTIGPAVVNSDGSTPDPMQGSDVKMLEQMLWQLGISPQRGSPGSEGARINSVRNSSGDQSVSCVTGQPQRRDTFLSYGDTANCSSTELMVKRYRTRRQHTEIITVGNTTTVPGYSGAVNTELTTWLNEDWSHYMQAFADIVSDQNGVISDTHGSFDAWAAAAAEIWQTGAGTYVPQTLSDEYWSQILIDAGLTNRQPTKTELLANWVEEESRYHWGNNRKGYQTTPYRMNEGGADENGSLSFSQVVYKARYGAQPCSAHLDQSLNLYHPADQLKAMVIHSASNDSGGTVSGTATIGCIGGMHRGFVGSQPMREEYNNTLNFDNGINQMDDFVGYISNADGALVRKNQTDREDDYEALAKAIAIYNGGTSWMVNFTWPRVIKYLTYQENSTSNEGYARTGICHSCKYSIKVRNQDDLFEGSLRRYVWRGDTATENIDINQDGEIDIAAGEPWCFEYGEEEWVNPYLVSEIGRPDRNAVFNDYRNDAVENDNEKIGCF